MVLSTAALAVGLAVGAVLLVVVLRIGLERASDEAARQTAQEVVGLIGGNRLPDPIPAGGTTLVQVVDDQGRVLAASAGADRLVPALPADELSAAQGGPITVDGSRFGVLGPVRVVALAAGSADDATVVVAAPAGDIDDAVRVVRTSLIVGFAVLLALLAAVAWRLVGATLRPVEALRAGAEKITGTGSTDILPLPDSADEIRRLAETLNDMLGRLESSRRRQRAFVADAAHELRSPLTSLRTQLEVGVATGEDPEAEELLVEVQRLTSLVDDLLLLARLDDATAAAAGGASTSASLSRSRRNGMRRSGFRSRSRFRRTRRCWRIPARCGGCWPTCWTTRSATRRPPSRSALAPDRTVARSWRSSTTAPGFRPRTASGSSNGSPGCTTLATGAPAAVASGWRSFGNWSNSRAVRLVSPTPSRVRTRPVCGCRCGSRRSRWTAIGRLGADRRLNRPRRVW